MIKIQSLPSPSNVSHMAYSRQYTSGQGLYARSPELYI